MDNKARLARLREEKYKGLLGVKKATFDKMLEILEEKNAGNTRKEAGCRS